MQDMSGKIKAVLAAELETEASDIQDDDRLVDLGVDSLTFLELIMEFKEEFKIDIAVNDISGYLKNNPIRTVGELTKYVQRVLSKELINAGN